jgi:hypothetical protein
MNHATRQKVKAWAKENGWPEPSSTLIPIATALITARKLSLICGGIERTVERLMLLRDRINDAVSQGNLMCVLLLKERYEEEKLKLAAFERLLDREAPMKKEAREGEITDAMIQRARDYPFEELLPEQLRRGRCRCPIHQGKNAMSFEVKDNYGKCYSCSWHGDTIKYVMDTQGKSFPEAVRSLC